MSGHDRGAASNGLLNGITPFPTPEQPLAPTWGSDEPRPRVLLYTHDSAGLGHTRRTLALAEELSRYHPESAILWLAGSPHLGAYQLPPNVDFLRMPWTGLRGAYAAPLDLHYTIRELRTRVIEDVVNHFDPDLTVVDFLPDGMQGELQAVLTQRKMSHPGSRIVLTLRDIIDEPGIVQRRWYGPRIRPLLEGVYDQILVYGSQEIYDLALEYDWSANVAQKITYCGYIDRNDPLQPPEDIRAQLGLDDPALPLVVVTVGGGWDGQAVIDAYLTALTQPVDTSLPELASFISTGPSLDPLERARFEALAQHLNHVTLVPFTNDMMSFLNAADLVISMGGFNSVGEILSLGKRAIIVPRSDAADNEQRIRAERFDQHGFLKMLHPDDLTPDTLAVAIRYALSNPAPSIPLGFGGLRNAGTILSDLLSGSLAARVPAHGSRP